MDKLTIGAVFREIATLTRLTGGNPFKAKAYDAGAQAIENLGDDLSTLVGEERLTELPGIGEAIASQVKLLLQTGTSPVLDKLRAQVPKGSAELALVPSMTLRRIRLLADALQVDSIASLKLACETHRLRSVRGFGPQTEAAILKGIASMSDVTTAPSEFLLVYAREASGALAAYARSCAGVRRVEIAGAVRRWTETVRSIDLVIGSDDERATVAALTKAPNAIRSEITAENHVVLYLRDLLRADLHVASMETFELELLRATGSAAHVEKLETLGLSGNTPHETEAALYASLRLAFVPPELREDVGEIEMARSTAFDDLLKVPDIRGMVHCHTNFSDGRNTILEMAREAERMGMKYLTITDHSPTAHYAGGVSIDRLKEQ